MTNALARHCRTVGAISPAVIAAIAVCVTGACTSVRSAPSTHTSQKAPPAPSSSVPAPPELAGHIVFARAGGAYGDETIFTADADGTHQHQIGQAGQACCAVLSRNGQQILYASTSGPRVTVALVRYDGSHRIAVRPPTDTLNLGPGAWSPNNAHIALQGWDDTHRGRAGIYVARSDGSQLRRLTSSPDDTPVAPLDYSPDGRTILLYRESFAESVGDLWLVGTDGTHLRRLTPPGLKVGIAGQFSPDGSTILFAAPHDQAAGPLYTIRPDGTHLRKIFAGDNGRFAIAPTWSPDGTQILFAIDPTSDDHSHVPNSVYVINADGSGLQPVLVDRTFKRGLTWRS